MKIVVSGTQEFDLALQVQCERGYKADDKIESIVQMILTDVREKGDTAVLEYTERFDGIRIRLQHHGKMDTT